MLSFFKINHYLNRNRKNRRSRSRQKVIKTKNDNVRAKSCMIEKNCEHIVKFARSLNWKCNKQKRKWLKDAILKSRKLFFLIKKIIDIDIFVDTLIHRWISSSNQRWIARHYLFTRLTHSIRFIIIISI
jgi:hypothetical protein